MVATGLTNHTRSHEPPAFPDVRRNLHSSARAPLFHRHTQSSEQAGEGPPVPTTIAPFAGQMCSSSTDLDSPDKAGGNSGDVGSSNGRSATSDFTADGHSLNSDSSKTAGRNPGTASTKHRGPWGRERSTSAPMPPQPVDDPEKAPPKTVSATYSSSVENQAKVIGVRRQAQRGWTGDVFCFPCFTFTYSGSFHASADLCSCKAVSNFLTRLPKTVFRVRHCFSPCEHSHQLAMQERLGGQQGWKLSRKTSWYRYATTFKKGILSGELHAA